MIQGEAVSDGALLDRARLHAARIVALRRAVHADPELGLETPRTLAKVRADLADLPLEWREGTSCTGAIAILRGAGTAARPAARSVLLRGDMDALPIEENTGLPFASAIAGRMHACGHDAHTAMLAGAARLLAEQRDRFAGEVRLMFQPGEEGFHGARHMLEEGLLGGDPRDPLPDAAFALHVWPNAPHGAIIGRSGPMMASADQIEITVRGRGGHASMPHDAADPVPVAAEIVLALQAMMTRRFDAAEASVLSITRMEAGSAHNIVPDEVALMGTIRTLSAQRRSAIRTAASQLVDNIARAHGCIGTTRFIDGFPVTCNDPRAAVLGRQVARALGGEVSWQDRPHPTMGAEDFSYVLEKVPGAIFFLGVAAKGGDWQACCGLHSSRMIVDERALPLGAAFLAGCALRFLARGWDEGGGAAAPRD